MDQRTVAARCNPEPRSYVVGCCSSCEVSHLVSSSRRSLRYPHGAYTRRCSVLLPASHTHHCGRQTLPTLHSHTQHPQERKPELCTRNTQFTNPKRANQNCVHATPNSKIPNNTNTHTGAHKRWWVEVKIQERLGEWVLSRNCGCEWGSRQVSTISDAGTRYALRLSQIQEYYSVDLSASVSLCGSLGVFIRYVEGFFASNFLIFILW